jgi:hypothetical protein
MIWPAFKLSLLVVSLATLLVGVAGTAFGFLLGMKNELVSPAAHRSRKQSHVGRLPESGRIEILPQLLVNLRLGHGARTPYFLVFSNPMV